jgi:hypothetical protein
LYWANKGGIRAKIDGNVETKQVRRIPIIVLKYEIGNWKIEEKSEKKTFKMEYWCSNTLKIVGISSLMAATSGGTVKGYFEMLFKSG